MMHPHVVHNNRLVTADKARVPFATSAVLYGRGVFTTLAIYSGQAFMWPQHWARLVAHADRIGVDRSEFDEASVSQALTKIIEANQVLDGRARVMLLARKADNVWQRSEAPGARKTDLWIITGEQRVRSTEEFALTLSPFRVNTLSPLVGVKSINYLDHLMAWEEARARDFDEAVMMNERGEVVSATMANIFWISDGLIHTPALITGALDGTTRRCVIGLAEEMSVPIIEGVYTQAQLGAADEIFLTSTGLEAVIVTMFDFRRYTVAAASLALRLREAFRQRRLRTQESGLRSQDSE